MGLLSRTARNMDCKHIIIDTQCMKLSCAFVKCSTTRGISSNIMIHENQTPCHLNHSLPAKTPPGKSQPVPYRQVPLTFSTETTPSASDSPRKLYVLLHNRNPLSMNRAKIGVLKKMYKEGFGCFLESLYRLRLPSHI